MNLNHDIFNLGINIFENDDDVEKFCESNRAIDGQAWLSKDALKLILEKGHYDNLNYFEDLLHIRIVLFYYNEKPIIIGPYLVEEMTIGQSIQVCNQVDKKKMDEEAKSISQMGSFSLSSDAFGTIGLDLMSAYVGNPEEQPLPIIDTFYFIYNLEIFEFTDKNVLARIEPSRKKEYKAFTRSAEILSHTETSALKVWNEFFVKRK